MDKYVIILSRVLKKRNEYIEQNNDIVDLHDFEIFIHKEYKKEILQLINDENIKSNSDLIRLHSSGEKNKNKNKKKNKRKKKTSNKHKLH